MNFAAHTMLLHRAVRMASGKKSYEPDPKPVKQPKKGKK